MIKHFLSYITLRALISPLAFLPYKAIHSLGKALGILAYYWVPKYRKRSLSNLALATDLGLSEKGIVKIAKESFQNLMITMLEYSKLKREKDISNIVTCENPKQAADILKEKGVIFFCAHQANWELLFLEATSRMPGVAIGRPIDNVLLYDWIQSIRQKFGGKMIAPKNAVWEGMRALKKLNFLGIVGEQGMPDSGYSSLFLGRRAWTSPLPAILSYRTGCPIIYAETRRLKGGRYAIHYSDPIWPNSEEPMEKEINRLMKHCLTLLENSIKERPGEWMWLHNRWKQQLSGTVRPSFKQDSILVVLPKSKLHFDTVLSHLPTLRKIYPLEFFTFFVPEDFKNEPLIQNEEIKTYRTVEDILVRDYRFKLVFNFHGDAKIKRHFLSLSAFKVATLKDLQKLCKESTENISHLLESSLYAK